MTVDGGLYRTKAGIAARLDPLVTRLADRGVTPDQVTWTGLLAAAVVPLLAVVAVATRQPVWLLGVVPATVARLGCAVVDGRLARRTGSSRPGGALLNEVADRAGDLLVCAALAVWAPLPASLTAIALLAADSVAAIAWAITGDRVFAGLGGKPDRAVLVAAGLTVAGLLAEPAPAVVATAWSLAGLGAISIVLRLLAAGAAVQQHDPVGAA